MQSIDISSYVAIISLISLFYLLKATIPKHLKKVEETCYKILLSFEG